MEASRQDYMNDPQPQTGTFPKDPSIDAYNREKWLRYDLQRSCKSFFEIATALKVHPESAQDKLHLLQRIEGLMLRSVRVESK